LTHPLENTSAIEKFERYGLDFAEGHISYQVHGSGQPVVFLHGASLDNGSITWRHVARDLSDDHLVYSPDLPKHGESWPWSARADQSGLESVVLRMLDAWDLSSVTIVGLSMGATVGLGVALNHPDRVNRLVLASCGGIQDRVGAHELSYLSLRTPVSWTLTRLQSAKSLTQFARNRLPYAKYITEDDIDRLTSAYLTEYESKRQHGGHLFSDWNRFEIGPRRMHTNHLPRIEELTCPTLFVHGSRDEAVPAELAIKAADTAERARAEIIEGAGHFLPQDHPAETVRIVRRFLEESAE
jgi:pimeloyl-ACP methyl ester carboxylesterase